MKKIFLPLMMLAAAAAMAQSRLATMPGAKDAAANRAKLGPARKIANLPARWVDGKTLAWRDGAEWVLFDAATGKESRTATDPFPAAEGGRGGQGGPSRGRQFTEVRSADGKIATYRDGNVFVTDGFDNYRLTEGGDLSKRLKYGSASWVYGEELNQNEAMGFSPDGSKIWVYYFDERNVLDYYLAIDQKVPQSKLYPEAYPKPGQPNPIVSIFVYDLKTKKPVIINSRGSLDDNDTGHYQYSVRWSPDGSRLLFRRANRRQNVEEYCSADPVTGAVQVLTREENPDGWVEQFYPITWLDQVEGVTPDLKNKALWLSERNGFCNIYVLDLVKGGLTPVTDHKFDVRRIVKVDPKSKTVWYVAANGDRPALMQLNRIQLDGKGQVRLTDPKLHHDVSLSDDGSHFIDTAQNNDNAPTISVVDNGGKLVKTLRESDVSGMKETGYQPVELIKFKAGDGVTDLWGHLHKPANFDPSKKYPVILQVYGGPGGSGGNSFSERFEEPDRMCDYGFIVLDLENRGLGGRGRAFRNHFYRKMGITEMDDQASGVKSILSRPYVDAGRVGVTGTSYGGYSTLLLMMRYPDIFHAGVSASCVSDWRNYDSTYTERYMGVLPDDKAGYDAGSAVLLAGNLKGWLMLYYGTSDDNTHPTNTFQVVAALQRAGKYHEVQVTPDAGHSGVNYNRMLEFFIERLVMNDSLPDGTKY